MAFSTDYRKKIQSVTFILEGKFVHFLEVMIWILVLQIRVCLAEIKPYKSTEQDRIEVYVPFTNI